MRCSGRIEFDTANIEDFVILRSDGHPTYHLSVVVDDVDMEITHVIRGDDHISNTPKHVLLFEALGAPAPRFAHVPLILGADKKRLSKRHGATSVTEYAASGLPAGGDGRTSSRCSAGRPGDDRELMSRDELIASFSLDGISGGNAVFNTEKLDWMNGQYIARMPVEELAESCRGRCSWRPVLRTAPIVRDPSAFQRLLELLRPRAKRLTDFVEQARPLLASIRLSTKRRRSRSTSLLTEMAGHLAALAAALGRTSPFDEPHVEAAVRGTAAERGIKAGALIHAARVALTGRTASPGLFEVMVAARP